jgi:hypothetical protein
MVCQRWTLSFVRKCANDSRSRRYPRSLSNGPRQVSPPACCDSRTEVVSDRLVRGVSKHHRRSGFGRRPLLRCDRPRGRVSRQVPTVHVVVRNECEQESHLDVSSLFLVRAGQARGAAPLLRNAFPFFRVWGERVLTTHRRGVPRCPSPGPEEWHRCVKVALIFRLFALRTRIRYLGFLVTRRASARAT